MTDTWPVPRREGLPVQERRYDRLDLLAVQFLVAEETRGPSPTSGPRDVRRAPPGEGTMKEQGKGRQGISPAWRAQVAAPAAGDGGARAGCWTTEGTTRQGSARDGWVARHRPARRQRRG